MSQSSSSPPPPSRVCLNDSEMGALNAADWLSHWRQQEGYVALLERRLSQQEGELEELRTAAERSRGLLNEAQQRERVLMRRLTAKEQEMQDYVCQLNELKLNQPPRSTLLDPAVNLILQQLKSELQSTRSKLEDTQNELTAWKFTPDSNTGKRLMAKCRLLYQENEELGKTASSGRIAKLESDLALQRSFAEEVRQSQNELDAFLADLDEDVEGMQSTILYLQSELKKSKGVVVTAAAATGVQQQQKETPVTTAATTTAVNGGGSAVACGERTDSDTEVEQQHQQQQRNLGKRVRRASVLSIDFNEEDTLVISTNGDVTMEEEME